MNNNQDIWVIVGFSYLYIKAQEENRALEEQYKNTVVKSRFNFPPEIRQKRLENLIHGPVNRGFFTSKEKAVEYLTNYPDDVHEMGYYTHILIERVMTDVLDGHYWSDEDGETWYKISKDFEKYEPCEKPECFSGLVGFA